MRYSLSKPQSYMRNNLQCFVALLETHRRFPQVKISLDLAMAPSTSLYLPLSPCAGEAGVRLLLLRVRRQHQDALQRGGRYSEM